jgi:PKHD-type hydroxylase
MSNYIFAPMPSTPAENNTYITWENGFTEEELTTLEKYCAGLQLSKASIAGHDESDEFDDIRISNTGWITLNEDTQWFYDRVAYIARQLNAQFYRFDLYGFMENMQYTIYEGDVKAHYDWHVDGGNNIDCPRKLSLVIQLSDPEDYEGGDLQFLTGKYPENAPKQKGLVAAFPSFRLHKVTPVTKGIRKSIVVWITGPAFR